MVQVTALKPGRYLDSNGTEREFTAEDLQATADAYDTSLHEAPIVIGHPKHDDPAYGWISGVRFEDGQLKFEADRVNPQFSEMHRSGAFRKHSAALYPPNDPRNPKPGVWYPRHLGFLGATPPAIKGLPQTEFSDKDDSVLIEFGEVDSEGLVSTLRGLLRRIREYLIESAGRETADQVVPDWEIESIEPRVTKPEADPEPQTQFSEEPSMPEDKDKAAQAAADIEAREQRITEREQAIAREEAARRRAGAVEFAEQLADKGRILPRHQPMVAELMLALPADQQVEFAEGNETRKEPPEKLFREFLESLPEAIEFGEKSGDDLPDASVGFNVPAGCVVDPERAELMRKAKAYQRQNGCEFSEAVDAVSVVH